MKIIRQGDVIFKSIDCRPKGLTTKHAQLTVQLGEATGHHHTLYPIASDTPVSWIEEFMQDNKRFVVLDTEWLLRHQEHNEIKIPKGTYEIIIEREWDPYEESMKNVVD